MSVNRVPWSSQTKLIVTLVLLFLIGLFLKQFQEAIVPLVLTILLAYILSPTVSKVQEKLHLKKRTVACLIVYLALIAILIILIVSITPLIITQFEHLGTNTQNLIDEFEKQIPTEILIGEVKIESRDLIDQAGITLQKAIEPAIGQTLKLMTTIFSSVIWIIFILIVSFYLVKDSRSVVGWIDGLAPPAYHQDVVLLRLKIDHVWGAFLRGQILLALVVAVIITLLGLVVGLRFALVMGILAGLLEFLPSVGHGIWSVLVVILALFTGSTWIPLPNWAFALLVLGLYMVYTQFDLNYLIPRIIGRSVNLPPLVVILGIVCGATIGGVLGVVLAAPAIASLRILARYIRANLFDVDPFPADQASRPLPPPKPLFKPKSGSIRHDPRD